MSSVVVICFAVLATVTFQDNHEPSHLRTAGGTIDQTTASTTVPDTATGPKATVPAATTTTTTPSDPGTGAPCAADLDGGSYGADVDHPERAPLQAARAFVPDTDRWAICGADNTFSSALLSVRSTDGGRHWTTTDTGLALSPHHAGDQVIVTLKNFQHATIRLISLVISRDDTYRTSDGGTTWTRSTSGAATPGADRGCAGRSGSPVPADFRRVDIDQDGRPDYVYRSANSRAQLIVVQTAAGGLLSVEIPTARPISFLATELRGRGAILVNIFSADSEYALVVVQDHCSLSVATNHAGAPYRFLISSFPGHPGNHGTGLGCLTDRSGRPTDLAGLSFRLDGHIVRWTRTTVHLHGSVLRNGSTTTGTYHLPQDQNRATLLGEIACGKRVLNP